MKTEKIFENENYIVELHPLAPRPFWLCLKPSPSPGRTRGLFPHLKAPKNAQKQKPFLCKYTKCIKLSENSGNCIDFMPSGVYNKDTIKERETPERKEAQKMKYTITTKTETIVITATNEEQLKTKVNFIKSFAEVISIERLIAIV